jgi:hypothetical protein
MKINTVSKLASLLLVAAAGVVAVAVGSTAVVDLAAVDSMAEAEASIALAVAGQPLAGHALPLARVLVLDERCMCAHRVVWRVQAFAHRPTRGRAVRRVLLPTERRQGRVPLRQTEASSALGRTFMRGQAEPHTATGTVAAHTIGTVTGGPGMMAIG